MKKLITLSKKQETICFVVVPQRKTVILLGVNKHHRDIKKINILKKNYISTMKKKIITNNERHKRKQLR